SKIAKEKLGNANRWPEIQELNKDQIPNANLIRPGQQLRLPPH
ncbi:MAG: LysM peptidoglycan-binding domain-containing protein, partial [Anaerolineae bacterium]|nr:LysM peptidoglycan-binding domain-containing protein [Anaerolineae bacterium]